MQVISAVVVAPVRPQPGPAMDVLMVNIVVSVRLVHTAPQAVGHVQRAVEDTRRRVLVLQQVAVV